MVVTSKARSQRAANVVWFLVGLCVLLNTTEAILVTVLLPDTSLSLSLQASAIAPLGVFHDLRWLAVYNTSWATFALEFVAILIVRGIITALSISLAWPVGVDRPSAERILARAMAATAVSAVFLIPSTVLLFVLAVVPISWLFIAAVPLAVAIVVILSPVAVEGQWWRRPIPLAGIGWVLGSFVAFSVGAVIVAQIPPIAAVFFSAGFGALNALVWICLVRAIVTRPTETRVAPVVPLALAALAAVVFIGSASGFSHATPRLLSSTSKSGVRQPEPAEDATQNPVLAVSGYGSRWGGEAEHPFPGPFFEQRFSYIGLGPESSPIPYGKGATVQSLSSLTGKFAAQVAALHRSTHRHVDVVAESEGELITETYLIADPKAPVGTVVLLSPLVAPGQATYPRQGNGSGFVSRVASQVLSDAYSSVSPVDLSPSGAFVGSIDGDASSIRDELTCKVEGVRQFAILPLADATASRWVDSLALPSLVVPAFHGGLMSQSAIDRQVSHILEGRKVSGSAIWRFAETIVSSASSAWQVPTGTFPGPQSLNPSGPAHARKCRTGSLGASPR
ncbi:MAG TPA: hypothetical protein VEJ87_09260 [Acidimicrobiales bacterium]|nr:hypothetical protein [Acidimicrobiales bacterium]